MAADELLVAPVEADPLAHRRAVRVLGEDELAAHGADARVSKGRDQRPDGARVELLAHIRQDHDLTRRLRHEVVQDRGLPSARLEGDDPDARVLVGQGDAGGAVRGSVGAEQDLEPVGGIVEGPEVLDPTRDSPDFVVRHDHHADCRLDGAGVRWPSSEPGARERQGRVAEVRIREEDDGGDED